MMYWDGAAAQVLTNASGTVSSVTATAPIVSSGGVTPNLSMPAATTAVNGYLTSIDFTTFNNKQAAGSYITALTGDVTAAGPGSAAATIANNAITTAKINNLAITDAKINDVAFSKITAKPTTLGGYGITDAISSTLTAGNIYVGSATNVATSTALSGDIASVSATGVVALSNTVAAGSVGSASAVPSITYDAKGRITATTSNAYQDATGATKGIVQTGTNITNAAGVISVATANTTTTGVITSTDWNIFNNKQNALGFTPVNKAGDTMTGNLILSANTSLGLGQLVTAQETTLIGTLSAADKGRTWFNTSTNKMMYWDGTTAQVLSAASGSVTSVTSANTDIGVGGTATAPILTLNSGVGANQIVKLDATSRLPAVSGALLTNLDATNITAGTLAIARGGTGATTAIGALNNLLPTQATNANKFLQTDGLNATWVAGNSGTVTNVTGTAPISVATGTSTPVISMAAATTAVNGYLTAVDFTTFNNKQIAGSYITALTGDITAAGPGSAAATIANNAITTPKINNLAITDAKINDVAFSKITAKPTTLGGYGITDAISSTLTSANIYVGNATNVATPVILSGDASMNNAGVLTLGSTVTAGSVGSASAVPSITYDAKGRITATTSNAYQDATGASKGIVQTGTNITNAAGVISVATANTTTTGVITSADWNIFNNKLTSGLAAGNVFVGNAGGVATSTSLSGDILSVSNTGVVALKNTGTAGTFGSASAIPAITTDAQGRVTGITTSAYQDGTSAAKGILQVGTNLQVTAGTISLQNASSTLTGALTSADWLTFNAKQNALGYTPVNRAGDTMTGSLDMGGFNITNTGNIIMAANKSFGLSQLTSVQQTALTGTLGIADKGRSWYNNTIDKMMYWDGAAAQVLTNASGSVSSVTATAPMISSGGVTPNLSMPAATTAVNGYLTSIDFTTFNNKQIAGSYITALTGDVTAAGPGSAAATIANNAITTAKINNLAITDAKINDVAFSKITAKPTTLGGYGITDAISSTLTAGNIYVGNATNVATSTALSGDIASVSATGVVTFANTVAAGSVGSASAVPSITYDAKGRITSTTSNAYQDATGASKGIVQAGTNINVAAGVISVNTANSTTTGVITSADWNIFNNKLTSGLAAGNVFVGNAGGVATSTTLSGDIASVSNTGVVALKNTGTAGTFGSASAIPAITTDAQGRVTGITTSAYQDGTAAAKGVLQVGTNLQVAAGVISLQNSSSTLTGALTSTDWVTFNAKQNALGFTPVNRAGDTMTGSLDMGGFNITNSGNIIMAANKSFGLSQLTSVQQTALTGTLGIADKGRSWYNNTTDKMMYWDGAAAQVLTNASGTVSSVTATAPMISSGGTTPNLSMPAATTTVNGYLTSIDWNTFNNKQVAGTYITALTGDVTAAGPGSAASTIANNAITTIKINNLAVTDAKINDVAFSKITAKPTTLGGYGIIDAISSTLTAGNIYVGNATNVATSTALTGDIASISATGVVALSNTVTAGSVGSASAVPSITYDAKGRITLTASNAYQDATGVTKGIVQVGTNLQVAAGILSLQNATTSQTGALTSTDWNTFNNKLTSVLTSANIFVGNIGNVATGVPLSGDATINNAGALTLNTVTVAKGGTGLTSGTSGGIPYFASTSTMASSAALTSNGVLLGGGAGLSPTSTAAGAANQVLRVGAGGGAPVFGALDISLPAAVTGVLSIANGGTNSSTVLNNNRFIASVGGKIVETAAVLGSRAVVSDINGLPAAAATTSTEVDYLSGVTNTNGGVVYGNGTALRTTASGTTGQVLTSAGAAAPVWKIEQGVVFSAGTKTTVIAKGSTVYNSPSGIDSPTVTVADHVIVIPVAGICRDFYIITNTANGAGSTLTATVQKGSTLGALADTALTKSIGPSGAAGVYSDNVNTFTAAAGDILVIKFTCDNVAPCASMVGLSFRCVPP